MTAAYGSQTAAHLEFVQDLLPVMHTCGMADVDSQASRFGPPFVVISFWLIVISFWLCIRRRDFHAGSLRTWPEEFDCPTRLPAAELPVGPANLAQVHRLESRGVVWSVREVGATRFASGRAATQRGATASG